MYRPHFQKGYDMLERIINRHAEDLIDIKLEWYEHKQDGEIVQVTPLVTANFKF